VFETNLVIVGNVLTAPEWRRTAKGTLVTHFRVASTARRLDRETGRWADGDSLRVRVTCWRRLAEGVASSVMVGDPVIVTGRMYTRDWVADDGTRRASYELDAIAAVVIGGTSLSGGVGSMVGTLAVVLLLFVIQNLIVQGANLNSYVQQVVSGGFLLVVVILQAVLSRRTGTSET